MAKVAFGTARVAFGTASVALGTARARFGTARAVFGTATLDALRSPDSLRPAPADLEGPHDLEGSAGPARSDHGTPCDRPPAISMSPTIWRSPPGPREASLISCNGVLELRKPDPLQNPRTTGPGAEKAATARDTRITSASAKGEKH